MEARSYMNYKDINKKNEELTIQLFYTVLSKLDLEGKGSIHQLFFDLKRYWAFE